MTNKKRLITAIFAALVLGLASQGSAATLFQENFEDGNFSARGWYDNTKPGTIVSGGQTGNALQWTWTQGQTLPLNGGPLRHQFTPTETLYISYYVKFMSGWRGSGVNYHPHIINMLSNLDGQYDAPGNSFLDTYLEFISATTSPYTIHPQIALQDNWLVNTNLGTPPDNITATTENRSVNYCNGCKTGQDCGDPTLYNCFSNGSGCASGGICPNDTSGTVWYSMDIWRNSSTTALTTNSWHKVEYYLQMNSVTNSVGNADGIMQMWVDGTQVINSSTVIYRTGQQPTKKFAQFIFAPYIGVGSPVNQTFEVDNLVVATDRTTDTQPLPPQNLRIISQ